MDSGGGVQVGEVWWVHVGGGVQVGGGMFRGMEQRANVRGNEGEKRGKR